jgi:hypothetical protein
MGVMKAFDERNYRVQRPLSCCRNCKHATNGGFPSNPLECEHPIELDKAIERGIRVVVSPLGICDEYDNWIPKRVKYETDSC